MALRHLYLRDYQRPNKQPVGCVAMEVDRDNNEIRYAVSVCSPLDVFNAKVARDKATGRLKQNPNVIKQVPTSAHEITKLVMNDLASKNLHQSSTTTRSFRAYQSAVGWLEQAKSFMTETA